MDPDRALTDLRAAFAALRRTLAGDPDAAAAHASTALDLFTGLDHWLTTGGFPPADWQPTTSPGPATGK
jgi:hypothetical protein